MPGRCPALRGQCRDAPVGFRQFHRRTREPGVPTLDNRLTLDPEPGLLSAGDADG